MTAYPLKGDELRSPNWIAITTFLMDSWDPIGVKDEPLAFDEYESYIAKVRVLLREGATQEAVVDYLDEIETKRMGFTSQRERGRPAARKLIELHLSSEAH